MTRYYFYAPSKYRQHLKKQGIIAFELQAFYAEKAYSQKSRKEVLKFGFLDDIDINVNTRNPGYYNFEFDFGKDGCQCHHASSYKELKERLAESGFRPVREKDYFRLRKLALKLMFRHTNFFRLPNGRNEYYYHNDSDSSWYKMQLAAVHFHHNLDRDTYKHMLWRQSVNIPNYNYLVAEEVDIMINKGAKGENPYQVIDFKIRSTRNSKGIGYKFENLESALKQTFYNREHQQVTLPQYERLRKIVKHLIWENSELDIAPLIPKQNYSVTILDF